MAGRTGAAKITAGSLDLASTIRGWELHLGAGAAGWPPPTGRAKGWRRAGGPPGVGVVADAWAGSRGPVRFGAFDPT
jgi:hypothetical protein